MQDYVLRVFDSPEKFGAFPPAGDFATVGRALCQLFLPLVAEGSSLSSPGFVKLRDGAFDSATTV